MVENDIDEQRQKQRASRDKKGHVHAPDLPQPQPNPTGTSLPCAFPDVATTSDDGKGAGADCSEAA
jgi:hypothetical protein